MGEDRGRCGLPVPDQFTLGDGEGIDLKACQSSEAMLAVLLWALDPPFV